MKFALGAYQAWFVAQAARPSIHLPNPLQATAPGAIVSYCFHRSQHNALLGTEPAIKKIICCVVVTAARRGVLSELKLQVNGKCTFVLRNSALAVVFHGALQTGNPFFACAGCFYAGTVSTRLTGGRAEVVEE